MRRLMLLRHAKSNWDHDDLEDRLRPLAPRGRRAAPVIGRHISGLGLVPDLVLCSTALRAVQTLELVTAEWERAGGQHVQVEMRASLYLASVGELLSVIGRLDDDIKLAMIIGHNPGMAGLALKLAARGEPRGMRIMAEKFPTAALAVIDLDVSQWAAVSPGTGFLQSFIRPKDLK